jgi:hypothetical protein
MKLGILKFSILFLIFSTLSIFATKGILTEVQSMELKTPDGLIILLNPDSTWEFKDGIQKEIERDFTVPVGGGKIVLISQNQKWGFVEKEIVYESDLLSLDSISAKGHSVNPDLVTATNAAQKQALQEATTKTKSALKKFKIDPLKITDCVKNTGKSVDKKEDFKKGSGWDVSVTILINKDGLLSIADCAKKVQDTTATKKKKK